MGKELVVVSTGGSLPFKIVHLAVPSPDAPEKEWNEAVKRALRAAEKSGFTSLSIPAIGTGLPRIRLF